jgi:hypothetical protein
MTLKIGTPNYSSNNSSTETQKTIYHRLGHAKPEQRTMVLRISPPLGELADRGIWSVYVKQHFGYTIPVVVKNETKHIPVTFNCIERVDKNKNVIQPCPECEAIAARKKKFAEKKADLMAGGKSEQEAEAALAFMKGWLREHNLDKKWTMVAKNLAGQWGFATISHTCYKLLKGNAEAPGLIDQLVAKKYDPLGVEKGVWIKFTRSGQQFNDIKDFPIAYTEGVDVGGERLERIKTDTLTQADLDQLEKLPALNTLGRHLTYDQIRMLVESGGDEATVRTVMDLPVRANNAPATSPAPVPAPTQAPVDEDDEVAKLQAALAAAQAKKSAGGGVTQTPTPKPVQPSAAVVEALDEDLDDFLAKYK